MSQRSRALTRWLCGIFVGAALGPGLAEAAPVEVEPPPESAQLREGEQRKGEQLHEDEQLRGEPLWEDEQLQEGEQLREVEQLRERAARLESSGQHSKAAEIWAALVDESSDPRERMLAYMHAAHAWMAAFGASGSAELRESAEAVLRRALADEEIDPRAREEFAVYLEEIQRATDGAHPQESPVVLLDPLSGLSAPPSAPGALPSSVASDSPRRSPFTIAGGVVLALAAPAIGGFVYAAVADRQLVREVRELDDYDPVRLGRLEDEAREVRAMAIGLGVTSAALVSTGVALVIAGHRRESRRTGPLALLPHATAGQGGLALVGRF